MISLISIPLATGSLIVGTDLFRALYPEEYLPGVLVLQVIMVGNVLGYMNWVLYAFLLSSNRQTFLMALSLGIGLGVAALSAVLVPRYGYLALPFLTAGVEACLFAVQIEFVRRIGYRRLWLRSLWRPAAAAFVMAIVLLPLGPLPLIVRICLGAVVYGSALYAFKGLGEQERAILRGLMTRISPGKS